VDLATITAIRPEIELDVAERPFGKLFQLSKFDLAIDFRLPGSRYLFVSIEPGDPRLYLIKRRLRDLEKASISPTPFSLGLRKKLSGGKLSALKQIAGERALLFAFDATDEFGDQTSYTLVAQLTGKSANLFLLDSGSRILDTAKETRGPGQQVGDRYEPPPRREPEQADAKTLDTPSIGKTISDVLDAEDLEKVSQKHFRDLSSAARNRLKQEISKREKLVRRLNEDLTGHGEAQTWKKFGDLLLANTSTATREGGSVWVTDYFDESAPEIPIPVDEQDSIAEAAEKFFKRYTKARNAGGEIENRLQRIGKELKRLAEESDALEKVIAASDEDRLQEIVGGTGKDPDKRISRKRVQLPSGTRSFVSSDGFEILVGKKAKDNDFLTFRVAKSLDTWMHAADYPGSHVVIRNPNRKEIPHKTLLEAAQLAAFYSQGKTQPKAAVHYTQKKFVNKPRGSAPGLVSLASFKTILVEPKIGDAIKR
jgi:predicted ribosome quality control (RQC) complex YloA/Tae2 family protein